MKINTRYYDEMLERFKQDCPMWANDIVDCRPKHMHAIRVTLRDGTQVDYNMQTKSFRRIDQFTSNTPDEITDAECKAIFANNLAEFMRMRGMGQTALAERTGLSSAMISKYLTQKSVPSLTNVKRIARALNCHPDELYE